MILNEHGHKRTANQLAKELVYEHGNNIRVNWEAKIPHTYLGKFTVRNAETVQIAICAQLTRVNKLLGNPNTHVKYENLKLLKE